MAASIPEYQITGRHPETREHERITHVYVASLSRWLPIAEVIGYIRANTARFYVLGQYNVKAYVGVVQPTGRPAYLRTFRDKDWTDNLVNLPGARAA